MGVLVINALLFGVCIRATDSWKLPCVASSSEYAPLTKRQPIDEAKIAHRNSGAAWLAGVSSCTCISTYPE